jgi:hypothetical protein
VHIGGLEYGPFLIDHENKETYTLLVDVPAGVVEVAIEDVNNDGPFEVSTITIESEVVNTSPEPDPEPAPRSLAKSESHVYDFAAGGNPAENIDCDWDGIPDLHEMIAGTDELDPESFFAARCGLQDDQSFAVTWPSADGKRYSLYRSTALDEGFQLIETDLAATPPQNVFVDHAAADGPAFYQVEVH